MAQPLAVGQRVRLAQTDLTGRIVPDAFNDPAIVAVQWDDGQMTHSSPGVLLVIDTLAERIERAVRLAELATDDALGEALVRVFPEATSGDEAPEVAHQRSLVIAASVREWVRNNVSEAAAAPTITYVRIGGAGPIAKCAVCGYPVIVNNEVTGERACLQPDAERTYHVPAPAFYPERVTVRDLIKKLEAEPNLDVPVLIGAPDGWYSYVGEYHAGPRDGMDENGGFALPTIDVGESWDARDL